MTPRPVRLLFVCVGNTCRSPLAAAVASALLGSRVQAESAGIAATPGRPAASEAIAVLQERCGLNLSTHRSRPLRAVTLAEFDRVIALDPSVYATLCQLCAIPPPHVVLWPLDDPYMQGLDAYHECLTQLQAMIEAQSPQWLEGDVEEGA